ncbi:MAG: type III pantothenate kinase [Saprospiraceae bacterium]
MNLCIDIGNTRIKIGIFNDGVLIYNDTFKRMTQEEIKVLFQKYKITKAISSSTRKSISTFEKRINRHIKLTRLTHKTLVPLTNLYQTPNTLGKDRLAGVVACTKLYPNQNCLVIDAGTCITYDIITAKKEYLGGNISPGLKMRAEAMDTMTSTLPIVKPIYNKDYIGKNTTMAMQNGIVYGTKFEIESLITMIKQDIGNINVIITGGDAQFFVDILNSKIFVHSYLILEGLDVIINYNAA